MIVPKIKILLICSVFTFFSCTGDIETGQKHQFSMTCKVDCINEQFITEQGRQKALEFFAACKVTKVYLESYRHGISVESEILKEVRDAFTGAGIQCAGCITTTQMSKTVVTEWDISTCFSDPSGREFLKETVQRTAELFDLIIIDDFFFTVCECPLCENARGDQTWEEFRKESMLDVSEKYLLEAARDVNSECKIIIKFPNWYEFLQTRGYDVIKQSEIFDFTFAGTETRESKPQTQACWYQSWLIDIGEEKCLGGWYDPLSTPPDIYVEQARQTILGGAKESLLHCYDYLDSDNKGLAIDKDSRVEYGKADAMALIHEIDGLQQMADLISGMKPRGILLAKKPNERPVSDYELLGKIGMLGIPFIASADLKENPACFFTAHASDYNNIEEYIGSCIHQNIPFIATSAFYNALGGPTKKQFDTGMNISDNTYIFRDKNGKTTLLNDLFAMDEAQLNRARNTLTAPFGLQISAPPYVSIHIFADDNRNIEVVENFNDVPVTVKLRYEEKQKRNLKLGLPSNDKVSLRKNGNKEWFIELAPRSLALLSN